MLKVRLRKGAPEQATALLSGAALFTDAGELEAALGEALAGCRHLEIDLSGLRGLDASLPALICSLHRNSHLADKKISLLGTLPRREDPLRFAGARGCRFRDAGQSCRLWEPLLEVGPCLPGRG